MDFSLLSPLEFFVDPKNVDGRNNKPPAMRVRVDLWRRKNIHSHIQNGCANIILSSHQSIDEK